MSAPSPHFLLVDDHALFRTGLSLMLAQNWPGARVSQATTLAQALAVLKAGPQPDLILLDVHLPDGHGLADLPQLREFAPDSSVLMMSAEVTGQQILQAREAGVTGFLPKVATEPEVMEAVRSALRGQPSFAAVPYSVLGQARAPQIDSAPVMQVAEAEPRLNERQRTILGYLGRGTPNKAIARQLGLSETDVRAEVSWLTEWLGASSREQAYALAVAQGLLQE